MKQAAFSTKPASQCVSVPRSPFPPRLPHRPHPRHTLIKVPRDLAVCSSSEEQQQQQQPSPPPASASTASSETAGLDVDSVTAKKQAEAERLKAAERFVVVGGENGTCKSCGYNYMANVGDPDFPVARGTKFQELPQDYVCPVCSAPKSQFESDARTLAGFAENQKYGLGFNSVTGNQKLLVIYGVLTVLFLLLIGGYALE